MGHVVLVLVCCSSHVNGHCRAVSMLFVLLVLVVEMGSPGGQIAVGPSAAQMARGHRFSVF